MEDKKNSEFFMVCEPEAIFEAAIQSCWDQMPDGLILTASDGTSVEVISRGEWNHEAGPDFLNAKIRYHGNILRGSIEMHRKSSDYIRHGHLSDAAYDNVILHVVTEDDLSGKSAGKALSHIPLCRLSRNMLERRAVCGSCRCRIFPYMHKEQLKDFFSAAGRERLQEKSKIILENIIHKGTASAFRSAFFRAAGYKRNQDAFQELSNRIDRYPDEVFCKYYRSILWGESGLLPDPAVTEMPEECRQQTEDLWEQYWRLRNGDAPLISWKYDSVRPLNMPERRVAMVCAFIERFGCNPLSAFAERLRSSGSRAFTAAMRKELILSDPFWDHHYNFLTGKKISKAVVLGSERAETLMTDVIAPAILAFAKLHDDNPLIQEVFRMFRHLAPQRSNRIFKNAVRRWLPDETEIAGIFDSAEMTQGCLNIYKRYCANTAGDCTSCLLGNS